MSEFEKLGFKAGLEIHQQLSGTKLFCQCPAEVREDEPDFSVARIIRAFRGESGEVDVAAAHAQLKQKQYVYQGYDTHACLVELDEEPVSRPGQLAVEAASMVAQLLDMTFVDSVHVMRKAVVDGSNTSGFQRTMLVAVQGMIHDVRVDRLCLEEDSCRIVSREQERDVYNLSRLGIPLLEITTKPDIVSPEHLKETAQALGMVLRSTGRVKRGLGTIRQDVNISIADGTRVEIKGVQDLDGMSVLAANEAYRQKGLVQLARDHKKVSSDTPVDVSAAFSQSTIKWIVQALKNKGAVVGVRVPNWNTVFGQELFAGYRVGTELSGYAKAWGFGGIIHSDEDPKKYGLTSWDAVRKTLSCNTKDAFFLMVGRADRAEQCITHSLIPRLQQFSVGVPSEVRKDNGDGTTTYLRPMPGAARMYPETDVRTFSIADIDVEIPQLLSERVAQIHTTYNIPEPVVYKIERKGLLEAFEHALTSHDKQFHSLIKEIYYDKPQEMLTKKEIASEPDNDAIIAFGDAFIERIANGSVASSSLTQSYIEFINNGQVDWNAYKAVDEDHVRAVIKQVVKNDPDAPMGALMGAAMKALAGKADGKTVSKLLREELK